MELTLDSTVRDVIASYPSTGDIFIQHGRMFRVRPGHLYASYDPPLTISEYAAINGLSPEALLRMLRAAAEADEARGDAPGGPHRTPTGGRPPVGAIGYTMAYRETGTDTTAHVPFTRALEARGPD